jgi:hypothetical protein
MTNKIKLYAFEPNGNGELSFYTIAKNKKEAFDIVDKYVKEKHFSNNKFDYDANGWGTDYYILTECEYGSIIEKD